jgi:predicted small lipoprotein YifL
MLKQFYRRAIRRVAIAIAAATTLAFGLTGCGIKGPLVPPPKSDANAETTPATQPTPPPLIKDPAQPERRP